MKETIRAEMEKASQWYDDHIFSKGGYENSPAFKQSVIEMILKYSKPKARLLDVACGNGNFLEIAESQFETYGVDFSKAAIALAKKRCKRSRLQLGPAEELGFEDNYFDVVVCLGSLEHFVDIHGALREMVRVLTRNGIAIIHVPNSRYLIRIIRRMEGQGQINERLATEREWRRILVEHFQLLKCLKYNPANRWYLKWIPKKFCNHFTFICRKA